MKEILENYAEAAGREVISQLQQLANLLKGKKVVHVNSTREGGGVAEILTKLIPLSNALGIDTEWAVIKGNPAFFQCTKQFHNGLQGEKVKHSEALLRAYEETNAENAEELRPLLTEADIVMIHDPQPAALLKMCPERKGKWVWRCHIDISHPYRPVWKYLRNYVLDYDASVFSLASFEQSLPHPQFIIPPSIDPLSEKNIELEEEEIRETCARFALDVQRPIILQVSRFDRFKDPIGVIEAYMLARNFSPGLQLVLAGGGAADDPEGEEVFREVQTVAADDPDIHILLLSPDAHRAINGLQRASDFVLQKSVKEGFGLTVTEAMWKGKPVIGGNAGGIRLQVVNHHTGFLVDSPEGAALRIRYLLSRREKIAEMGEKARIFVRDNFLLTRQLREYLTMMVALFHERESRIVLG
jgi:trehalose synthase